tara:strand:+ start:110 stop:568 length:459 start_codon:yes stop_codon:yes gene_type:complete
VKLPVELNNTYKFELETPRFGSLSKEQVIDIFTDGRHCSPFLERQLAAWFEGLTHITGNKPYDLIDEQGRKYDAKNFTKKGLKFMPSGQIGTGRKYDYDKCRKKIEENKMTYIACDITEFPKVRVRFLDGSELLKEYPKAQVPFKDREVLFG